MRIWPLDCIQSFGHEMLSWVRLCGINAYSVSPPARASWYQFTLLGDQGHQNGNSCPQLLFRKSVVSGIEPATPRAQGQSLNHTTINPPVFWWPYMWVTYISAHHMWLVWRRRCSKTLGTCNCWGRHRRSIPDTTSCPLLSDRIWRTWRRRLTWRIWRPAGSVDRRRSSAPRHKTKLVCHASVSSSCSVHSRGCDGWWRSVPVSFCSIIEIWHHVTTHLFWLPVEAYTSIGRGEENCGAVNQSIEWGQHYITLHWRILSTAIPGDWKMFNSYPAFYKLLVPVLKPYSAPRFHSWLERGKWGSGFGDEDIGLEWGRVCEEGMQRWGLRRSLKEKCGWERELVWVIGKVHSEAWARRGKKVRNRGDKDCHSVLCGILNTHLQSNYLHFHGHVVLLTPLAVI